MTAAPRRFQQGVVLFIALIVLVAMSLAGIALLRSVDTGTIIAGNLAFRQNAVHVADLGIEAARSYLSASGSTLLDGDQTGDAYYATWQENLDLLGNDPGKVDFVWTTGKAVTAAPYAPPKGYAIRYVIHRLCETSGPTADANCIKFVGDPSTSAAGGTKGAATYGSYAISIPTNTLFRITVRVVGPRNTLSYVQATVY